MERELTGLVLIGGKSLRMGTDKGLMRFHGKSFIQYIIEALKPLVSEIILVGDNKTYDCLGYTRFCDLIKDAGPLSGLYTGLKYSKTIFNLVISCDVPLVNTDLLRLLLDEAYLEYDAVQFQSQGKTVPLVARYHKSCTKIILETLNKGEKKVMTLVKKLNVKTIKLNKFQEYKVKNINTPQDLKSIENGDTD